MDLEGEEFIDADEIKSIWNRAVSVAESHLITLGLKDKYFLTRSQISLVQGQEAYNLPAALFGNKIRKIIYKDGADFYSLKPLKSKDMFEEYAALNDAGSSDVFHYMIMHDTPGVQKLILVPTPYRAITNVLTVWFSRSANRYTTDADICDVPEIAYEFLQAYVREKVYEKESHENYEGAKADRMEKEQLMQSVLSGQTDDDVLSEVEMDMSAYQEST